MDLPQGSRVNDHNLKLTPCVTFLFPNRHNMNPPPSLPDVLENEEAIATANNDDTSGTKSENGYGATTQPENSEGGSSINGEQGRDHTSAKTAVSPSPQDAPAPRTPASVYTAPSQTKTFVYDPNKITLKFIFANRDGLNVILDCTPADTVGEVKGALLSLWPEDMPECNDGDRVRLICMGKGILMPDSKSLGSLDVPVFKTHATPVNVAVRPDKTELSIKSPSKKSAGASLSARAGSNSDSTPGPEVSAGCSCVIL